jgi:hypothetical protein
VPVPVKLLVLWLKIGLVLEFYNDTPIVLATLVFVPALTPDIVF